MSAKHELEREIDAFLAVTVPFDASVKTLDEALSLLRRAGSTLAFHVPRSRAFSLIVPHDQRVKVLAEMERRDERQSSDSLVLDQIKGVKCRDSADPLADFNAAIEEPDSCPNPSPVGYAVPDLTGASQ